MQVECIESVIDRYWGFAELCPLQHRALIAELDGRDSLAVMPTGSGKSLCFQAPAVHNARLTVVVSPLIALMQDQVRDLDHRGVRAAALHGDQHIYDYDGVLDAVRSGRLNLLYLSPERVVTPECVGLLHRVDLRAFIIDEAHCISHWGHDFRPAYARLGELRALFPDQPIHAYTASAVPAVRDDITEQLGLRNPDIIVGDFDRPNLILQVLSRRDMDRQLLELVRGCVPPLVRSSDVACDRRRGIVYCPTRAPTEQLARYLVRCGIAADHYHAAMDPSDRDRVGERFHRGLIDVIVATIAFGMGIDIPDDYRMTLIRAAYGDRDAKRDAASTFNVWYPKMPERLRRDIELRFKTIKTSPARMFEAPLSGIKTGNSCASRKQAWL